MASPCRLWLLLGLSAIRNYSFEPAPPLASPAHGRPCHKTCSSINSSKNARRNTPRHKTLILEPLSLLQPQRSGLPPRSGLLRSGLPQRSGLPVPLQMLALERRDTATKALHCSTQQELVEA